ncbi:MAG: T9SS type A sorting domain-containing protein [Bacteroidota bacterium]
MGSTSTDPSRTLDVNGDARLRNLPTTSNSSLRQVRINSSGVLHEYIPPSSNATENKILAETIQNLEKRIAQLEALLGYPSLEERAIDTSPKNQNIHLQQNAPNPFSNTTSINYSLPENAQNAEIQIRNLSGVLIKSIAIEGSGTGTVNLEGYSLQAGTYTYSLIADGQILATKQMILTNQ